MSRDCGGLGASRGRPFRPTRAAAPADLRGCADPALQAGLEQVIGRLGFARRVADRRFAVALVDLSTAETPGLAMLNGDEMMYAASLPKIAILLGAFVQAERGKLALDEPTLASLNRMIRNSSNADASAMLAKVGEATLLDILTSPRYHFYDAQKGGKQVVVDHPDRKAAAYRRDPVAHLSHGATAFQVARFYYMLDRGFPAAARPHPPDEGRPRGPGDPPQVREGPRVEARRAPLPQVLARGGNSTRTALSVLGARAPLHPRGDRGRRARRGMAREDRRPARRPDRLPARGRPDAGRASVEPLTRNAYRPTAGSAGCSDSSSFCSRVASSMWTEAELRRSTFETIVTM